MTPDVIFHASAGTIGLLAGAVALIARKGSPVHRGAGNVFVVALLVTTLSALWLAFKSKEYAFIVAAILLVYFMITAWMAVKRKPGEAGWFEVGAFLFAATGSALMYYLGFASIQNGTAFMGGIPVLTFATVAAACALGDLGVVLRRGISGKQRIARHLWRMHIGLFAAVGSFFPGQLDFFPEAVQQVRPIILLFIPPFAIAGMMLVWMAWLIFTKRFSAPAGAPA